MKLLNPKDVKFIIVHALDTTIAQDVSAKDVRKWHTSPDPKDPSKPWEDIGYHRLINRRGIVEIGRDLVYQGAQCRGYNAVSVSIALAGGKGADGKPEFNYTKVQMQQLNSQVELFRHKFPSIEKVVGHNYFDKSKACPCFNVEEFFK